MRNPPLSIHAWLRYAAIHRLLPEQASGTALEIGVGGGAVGVLLARQFDYVGVELDDTAISLARRRFERHGLDVTRLLNGGLESVEGRTFDLVCAFEVLEHLQDDRGALEEWRSLTRPGGTLLFSVPAGPERFGAADRKAGHFRRYRREDIRRLLANGDFARIRMLNYGYPAGYALEAARNLLARRELRKERTQVERTLASGRWLQPADWAAPITRAAAIPLQVSQRPFMELDRGTGVVVAATRE
ncbi:MAG: class I SAM-dependent methyltransferase [Gaiellaceae bacterium]